MDFVLVHGGCHSGWCWNALQAELELRGHRTWAPDLPIEDVENGSAEYASTVIEKCEDAGPDAVIVGHSLGGLTIPLVATQRPTAHIIFLDAAVPEIGRSYQSQHQVGDGARWAMADRSFDDAGRYYFTEQAARELFYHDCPPSIVAEAVRHLRPNGTRQLSEVTPLKRWPDIPVSFVYNRDDRCMPLGYGQRVAREHFDAEVTILEGGHSPFLARPKELADLLLQEVSATR